QLWVSLLLLPLDTSILIGVSLLGRIRFFHNKDRHHRRNVLRNPRFYPKTILITGVGTARGLALARQFHYGGHRVIGADVGLTPIRSGGSMSKAVHCCYSISKTQYVCNLLDIINREKVDIWVPFLDRATPLEDGVAKSTIESRTSCKCVHFNVDSVTIFSRDDLFLQHVGEKGLSVFERHNVKSRDSVHRILNGSPSKNYVIHTTIKGAIHDAVLLPRRTPSQTYSDVSELQITKDHPWVLQQRARLGSYWADFLLIQGCVKAMKIRYSSQTSGWQESSLNSSIHEVTRQLMERFADKGKSQMSGHLSVKFMVDEEIKRNTVCYTVYLAGCRQGTAVSRLLDDPPPNLFTCYLEILPTTADSANETAPESFEKRAKPIWPVVAAEKTTRGIERFTYPIETINLMSHKLGLSDIWNRSRFSSIDPLPWWWHLHISQPLNDLVLMVNGSTET
ncbi:hypothetical protein BGW36DRAFT_263447, partial [Talaromyces proteolyticus]